MLVVLLVVKQTSRTLLAHHHIPISGMAQRHHQNVCIFSYRVPNHVDEQAAYYGSFMDVKNQSNSDNHCFQIRCQRNPCSCSSIHKTRNVLSEPAMADFHFKLLHLPATSSTL